MNSIFTDIINGNAIGHFIYEDENHIAILDKYPIDVGHCLIIPRKHYEKITDMSPENVGRAFSIAPKIAKAVMEATGADAFSIGQNNGRSAKQIIPHMHIHIIPRYHHKGTIWTKRQISTDSELSELAKKIHSILT